MTRRTPGTAALIAAACVGAPSAARAAASPCTRAAQAAAASLVLPEELAVVVTVPSEAVAADAAD